ncbi:MAG: nuclear transport factor 2 family protein [Comamonadaceae bacterium]|nr:MAG: nuclear transport factor 2 family protein [Comamonadaceae bacterium]
MSIEDNRRVALAFFERYDAGDMPGVLDLMAADITYWLAGKPGSNATSGARSKAEMADIFRRMEAALNGRLRMAVKGTVAEGDRVAVEAASRGELRNGRVYEQEYHVLFTVRDGKIAAAREYMDTAHVNAIWYTR